MLSRLGKRVGRLALWVAVAFFAQEGFSALPSEAEFPLVFVSVYLTYWLSTSAFRRESSFYFQDLALGLFWYCVAGLTASALDKSLSRVTGRHGTPAVPAMVLLLIDQAWTIPNWRPR